MQHVFIGLGSNLGDRLDYLNRSLKLLASIKRVRILKCSSVYETQPVGVADQPLFLNMVVELESELSPYEIFNNLKRIEKVLGRTVTGRWGPREIDLDLLYYGNKILDDGKLSIPHPEITNRKFVLVPLKEIAPEFCDPVELKSIENLLSECTDTSEVRKTDSSVSIER